MSNVNMNKNVIEEYVGEDGNGFNVYRTIYNPKMDNAGDLYAAVQRIRREERDKIKRRLLEFIKENFD